MCVSKVSVVTYSNYTVKEAGKNKTVGTFEVRGKAWDELLGGEHFDLAVTPFLFDVFWLLSSLLHLSSLFLACAANEFLR